MNTSLMPLNDLLAMYAKCEFVVTRRDRYDYAGVLQFVQNARSKGMNDYNIASLIQIETSAGLQFAISLSKSHAAAGVSTSAAAAFYTGRYSTTLPNQNSRGYKQGSFI